MQELQFCQNIIRKLREKNLSKSFRRVKHIQLEIGEFARINKPAIQFCFNQASHGTVAEGAKLEFIDVPASALCEQCNQTFLLKHPKDPCYHCDALDIKLLSGKELAMRNFEVE